MLKYTLNFEEESSTGIDKTSLFTSLRKGLAGKTTAQHIMRRNLLLRNLTDVETGIHLKVFKVSFDGEFINLRGKHALTAQLFHGHMETTNSGKKIYKLKFLHFLNLQRKVNRKSLEKNLGEKEVGESQRS